MGVLGDAGTGASSGAVTDAVAFVIAVAGEVAGNGIGLESKRAVPGLLPEAATVEVPAGKPVQALLLFLVSVVTCCKQSLRPNQEQDQE